MRIWRQMYASSAFMLFFFTFGYVLGMLAILMPQLKSSGAIKLTIDQESSIASASFMLMFPSAFITGVLTDKFGRKYVYAPVFVPYITGFTIIYFANSYATLFLGVITLSLSGGGIALGHNTVMEVCTPKYRGTVVNMKQISSALGVTLSHFLGYYLSYKTIALLGMISPVIGIATTLTSPESPAWLAGQGRFNECKKSFKWLRGDDEQQELDELIYNQKRLITKANKINKNKKPIARLISKLTNKGFIKSQCIAFVSLLLYDSTGKHTFLVYAIDIITSIIGKDLNPYFSALGIDCVEIIAAVICVCFYDKFKRRTLLIGGGAVAVLLITLFCILGLLQARSVIPSQYSWVSLIVLTVYFLVVQVALIPSCFVVMTEVVPLEFKGLGQIVSGFESVVLMIAFLKATPFIILYMSVYGLYAINCVAIVICLSYLYFAVPETKGRTLQDVENEMRGDYPTINIDDCKSLRNLEESDKGSNKE